MASYQISPTEQAPRVPVNAEQLFTMGIACSQSADHRELIEAHKWFNLAAAKGNRQASDHRQEVALELSAAEIASAQKAARDWLRTH